MIIKMILIMIMIMIMIMMIILIMIISQNVAPPPSGRNLIVLVSTQNMFPLRGGT